MPNKGKQPLRKSGDKRRESDRKSTPVELLSQRSLPDALSNVEPSELFSSQPSTSENSDYDDHSAAMVSQANSSKKNPVSASGSGHISASLSDSMSHTDESSSHTESSNNLPASAFNVRISDASITSHSFGTRPKSMVTINKRKKNKRLSSQSRADGEPIEEVSAQSASNQNPDEPRNSWSLRNIRKNVLTFVKATKSLFRRSNNCVDASRGTRTGAFVVPVMNMGPGEPSSRSKFSQRMFDIEEAVDKISSRMRAHTTVEYQHYLVPKLSDISTCSYYWGIMDRYEAESLLENKPEGTFLLRDSSQEDFIFSVSFRRYGRSLHARIEQWCHQFSFDAHESASYKAKSVPELIERYKDPQTCMFFEPLLTRPLSRNRVFSLQHLARTVVCDNIDYDSIDCLELPRHLQEYLQYYHYKQKIRVIVNSKPITLIPLNYC